MLLHKEQNTAKRSIRLGSETLYPRECYSSSVDTLSGVVPFDKQANGCTLPGSPKAQLTQEGAETTYEVTSFRRKIISINRCLTCTGGWLVSFVCLIWDFPVVETKSQPN